MVQNRGHTCLSSYPEFKIIGGSNRLKNKVCLNDYRSAPLILIGALVTRLVLVVFVLVLVAFSHSVTYEHLPNNMPRT